MSKTGPFLIGMDAGGTKTGVCLADENGRVFDTLIGGGMNVNSFGVEETGRHLAEILQAIREKTGGFEELKGLCIGVAGATNPATRQVVEQECAKAGISVSPLVVGDHVIALYAAGGTGEGIAVISGTGSVCFGRTVREDGTVQMARSGGWGHLIDDEGSAYAIGRDVLSALVRSHDGRQAPTVMWPAFCEQTGIQDMPGLISFVYGKDTGKKEIAQLAPLVMKGVEAGEKAAVAILHKAADQLSDMVAAVAGALGITEGKAAVFGSVLTKNETLLGLFKEEMKRKMTGITVGYPDYEASLGAIFCLQDHLAHPERKE